MVRSLILQLSSTGNWTGTDGTPVRDPLSRRRMQQGEYLNWSVGNCVDPRAAGSLPSSGPPALFLSFFRRGGGRSAATRGYFCMRWKQEAGRNLLVALISLCVRFCLSRPPSHRSLCSRKQWRRSCFPPTSGAGRRCLTQALPVQSSPGAVTLGHRPLPVAKWVRYHVRGSWSDVFYPVLVIINYLTLNVLLARRYPGKRVGIAKKQQCGN